MRTAIRQVLGTSHLFEGLRPELIDEIAASATRRTLGTGEILFQKGDPADALWGVLSGRITIEAVTEDGKELVLDSFGKGEVFGEVGVIDFGPRRVEARAAEQSELFRLERQRFLRHLNSSPELCFRVFSLLCSHLRQTTEDLEDTALYKLPSRLAKRLIMLATGSAADSCATVHIAQAELARMLGVNREAVNRHLRAFEKDGLIAIRRQEIEILDRQGLAGLASPRQSVHHVAWGNERLGEPARQPLTSRQPRDSDSAPQERHCAGLLAIDAADYSRSLMLDAAETLKRIEAGLDAIDRAIEQYRGHTVWHTGDRVLAEFPTAQLAMQAAFAIQDQVNPAHRAGEGKQEPLFRIGVHHGEVRTDDHRFSGEAVNTAIRLTQFSGAGGIAISAAIRDALESRERLELQFLGHHELENVPGTVPVYSARAIPALKRLALRAETMVPRRFRLAAATAAALVVSAGLWLAGDWVARRNTPVDSAALSIAVLPFANHGDTGLEYLAQGIPEQIRSSLSRIPVLRVIGQESASHYDSRVNGDVEFSRIGEELNVAYLVAGSMRDSGDRVSITAQLVRTDGSVLMWSETFDRPSGDIFEIQNEISAAVLDEFKVKLLGAAPSDQATDPEVYALYLQGRFFENLGNRSSRIKAFDAYQQALDIDPGCAPAWMGVAMHYQFLLDRAEVPQEEGFQLALEATEKALAADDDLALAWCGLGYIKMKYAWDWEGARTAIDKALQMDPNSSNCVGAAASLAWSLGQSARHVELREKAVDLDPLSLSALSALGQTYVEDDRPGEALQVFEKIVAINPDYPGIYEMLGRAYLRQGDASRALVEFSKYRYPRAVLNRARALIALGNAAEAQAAIDEYLDQYANFSPFWTGSIQAWLGDNDSAFEWLDIALQRRNHELRTILTNPYLRGLQDDPRYPEFLAKMGLLQAWQDMEP